MLDGYHSKISFMRAILLLELREDSAGQLTIQCSQGSPATRQHPKNGLFHDIGEDMISSGPRKFNRRYEGYFQYDNEIKNTPSISQH
jgi:hypothetical protein